MTVDYVTRAEFDGLAQRVSWLDEHGTRGVGALQIQVTSLAKDIAKVEAAQDAHVVMHRQEASAQEQRRVTEEADRKNTRRWVVAGVIIPTASVLMAGGGILVAILSTR